MMKNIVRNLTETLKKFDRREILLPEVTKEICLFFEALNVEAQKVSAEKREEFTIQFIETTQAMLTLIRPYIESIPLGNEKLISSLDNPDFFDPDDWKAVQEAKERLTELSRSILPHLSLTPKLGEKIEQEHLRKGEAPQHAPRSKWLKS
jgi:hypothetical protein